MKWEVLYAAEGVASVPVHAENFGGRGGVWRFS